MNKNPASIGLMCSMVPEEIIYAANLHPKRLFAENFDNGNPGPYSLPANFCSLVKTYNNLLNKQDIDIDGCIFTTACNATDFLYDSIKPANKFSFVYMLDIPRKKDQNALLFFESQLFKLTKALENCYGIEITPGSLAAAIEMSNKIRSQLELCRKARHAGFISGLEYYQLIRLLDEPDKENAINTIDKRLHVFQAREMVQDRKRLLLLGSPILHTDLLSSIESEKFTVFMDDICSMDRYAGNIIDTSGNLLKNLAAAYLNHYQCSRMETGFAKIEKVNWILRQYKPDGVIYNLSKFRVTDCYESVMLYEDIFRHNSIPFLVLENEITNINSATRLKLDNFLEILCV